MKNKIDFNDFNNDNLEQLKNYLEENKNKISKLAVESLQNIIDKFDNYKDEETKTVDLYGALDNELDGKFIYCKDAYEYLSKAKISNFKEAFDDFELYEATSIAEYYLR